MKSQTKKRISNSIENVLIVIFLILLIGNVANFYIDYKNVDLGYNSLSITSQVNDLLAPHNLTMPEMIDVASDGVARPISDYYASGMKGLRNHFQLTIIYSFFLGVLLCNKFEVKK